MCCQKCIFFDLGKKPGSLASQKELCGTPGQLFKTGIMGTVPENPGRMGSASFRRNQEAAEATYIRLSQCPGRISFVFQTKRPIKHLSSSSTLLNSNKPTAAAAVWRYVAEHGALNDLQNEEPIRNHTRPAR